MRQLGIGIDRLTGHLAAVGPKTAAELALHGLKAEVIPSDYVAEGMLASLKDRLQPGERVLLPRADIARKTLPEELRRMGLDVTEVDVYHTVIDAKDAPEAAERLRNGLIDVIAFTSSSTVSYFMEAMAPYGGNNCWRAYPLPASARSRPIRQERTACRQMSSPASTPSKACWKH